MNMSANVPEMSGLTALEAAQRLERDGPNALPQAQQRTTWRIAREVASEPMFQLLLAAALIYLFLGDLGEALMLLAFVLMIAGVTLVQERRTERVLEVLRDLTSPHAVVIRDGVEARIDSKEVVCGDLLVLGDGDRIAADAVLLSANDLQTDESLLTGEAVAVSKLAATGEPAPARPGGDKLPFVYAGTTVLGGQGLARVQATGARSEIGRIGKLLNAVESPPTPLHTETRRLVRVFSVAGLAFSVLVAVLYSVVHADILGGVLAGITLAMSMLPQEFLLILTVFMAMGAWRMSRHQVLARRSATIEALGSATVLCTDKTGTLTQNRMSVAEMAVPDTAGMAHWRASNGAPPVAFHTLLTFGMLASERAPVDPMEQAIHRLYQHHLPQEDGHRDGALVHEYNLSTELLAMTHVWQMPGQTGHTVAVKGAPEAVAGLCRLSAAHKQALLAKGREMADSGLRVLAVASASWDGTDWPASQQGFAFSLLGLVALADPIRPTVPAAIAQCRSAGIRVVMITGDFAATAQAIAAQAGMDTRGEVLTGGELATMSDADLAAHCGAITVFARVLPEQKLRIVNALKARGDVVAMTGDGVNDAPSLKAAHIGIAMGARGTDVAREAASLVLLDDDFGGIVKAIRLGRRIYDNMRKAMAFVLAVHVPIAGLSLLPLLLGLPSVFMPVHIAFLELVIDPVSSIVFEAETEEPDVMQHPPRNPALPLFSHQLLAWSLGQGALVLGAIGLTFMALLQGGVAETEARATVFCALVVSNFGLIAVNRSFSGSLREALTRPNSALLRIFLVTSGLLAVALYTPMLRELFHFAPPRPAQLAMAIGVGIGVSVLLAGIKRWNRSQPGAGWI